MRNQKNIYISTDAGLVCRPDGPRPNLSLDWALTFEQTGLVPAKKKKKGRAGTGA